MIQEEGFLAAEVGIYIERHKAAHAAEENLDLRSIGGG